MIYIPLALLIASVALVAFEKPPVTRTTLAQLVALWAIGAALILPHVWHG